MSYESRAYDNVHGDPTVVLVVTGTHDVSRLVNLLAGSRLALCEHIGLSERILRQVKRHNGGQAALTLLLAHGGAGWKGRGCDWAAFGLIAGPWEVIKADGRSMWAFPIADAPKAVASSA